MENLRITNVTVIDSSSIDIEFTHVLNSLTTGNISILADRIEIPNSKVLEIKINKNLLSITCQPLTAFEIYSIQLQSTETHPFISLHAEAKLVEDGVSNKYTITGPIAIDNPIKNYLTNYFRDNVYELDDEKNIVVKYINALSVMMSKALYDIQQLQNENYLSVTILDEEKSRTAGPFDRLSEKGAYELIRLGRTPTGTNVDTLFSFDNFPSNPITLQKISNIESFQISSENSPGFFNNNSLIFNFSTKPISKVNKITFTLTTSDPIYEYDIVKYGYQIKDSRYDREFGFTYLQLEDNQIRINDQILNDSKFDLSQIFKIDVEYEYKNLGRVVNQDSVNLYTSLSISRESLPPIINIFQLKHAPIVDTNGDVANLNGINFINPNSANLIHKAFLYEIPFRLNSLPILPGQYSIDYSTGTVYVFGEDLRNDGTGAFPPLASYSYRFDYRENIDYTYESDLLEIAAIPTGSLTNYSSKVNFSYEDVFIPGVDYESNLHIENLNERINNNLVAANTLKTKNFPITNVFKVYNETTGEIYPVSRWNDNKVYFKYNTPPNIENKINERVVFKTISNELLFVKNNYINSLRIFEIFLNNNNVSSATEDGLGSSINSSLNFSSEIFKLEKWYDVILDKDNNINNLNNIGEYCVDYKNGIIYLAVSNAQNFNLGTASYKINTIDPQFPHLISIDDIYSKIDNNSIINKKYSYLSFADDEIILDTFNVSDESFKNDNAEMPYQLFNKEVGVFSDTDFISGVTNNIKFVRKLYEFEDLTNSINPLDFSSACTISDSTITVNKIENSFYSNVLFDGVNYYILFDKNIPFASSNITYNFSVLRGATDLFNYFIPGENVKLILISGVIDELVKINYSFEINDISRIVVDYNRGDLFVDYNYLLDEILVSYEYGDNSIDFRKNETLSSGDVYYVSYKVGALRDALNKNFSNLLNIPELSNIDVDFDRERYRDALMAALSSFIKGPTISALKNIGKTISHVEPEIIESVFEGWSLGNNLLNPTSIKTSGEFQLLPGKFGNGVLVNQSNQSINIFLNSCLRIEEGTFESWIIPQWYGLDNDANLTFFITKDGYNINDFEVFIGSSEYHPEINGSFTLNKLNNVFGKPNKNKDGIYIYYDKDISEDFFRWYLEIIDGNIFPPASNYKIKITTDGKFYDSKTLDGYNLNNLRLFTGTNSLNINVTGGTAFNRGITFLSDVDHYLLDFGKNTIQSRLSIYKDVGGYLNLRAYDKDSNIYTISSNVSNWKKNQQHFISASWKLNSKDQKDELHLFVDGMEIPNKIKSDQKIKPYLHENFSNIHSYEVIGFAPKDIVGADDLVTALNSDIVSSSINFSAYNISPGDIIFIDEIGFSPTGYSISSINGQTLVLSSILPATLESGKFSINRTSFTVSDNIDLYTNTAITTVSYLESGNDLTGTTDIVTTSIDLSEVLPGYSIRVGDDIYTILEINGSSLKINKILTTPIINAKFFIYSNKEIEIPGERAIHPSYIINSNEPKTIELLNNVKENDLLILKTFGLNNRKIKQRYYVWSNDRENIIPTRLPDPVNLNEVSVRKIILPTVSINLNNSTFDRTVFTYINTNVDQPVDAEEGRTISVTLSGDNIDFGIPAEVTIDGITISSSTSEILSFTKVGTLSTSNKFFSINSITVVIKPLNSNKAVGNIEIKEKYSITHLESGGTVPVIRYAYPIGFGYQLYNDGYGIVTDDSKLFSHLQIGNYLIINNPISVAGFYKIQDVSLDRHSLTIIPTHAATQLPLPSFTDGIYQILNVTENRTGLQNGFFTFEIDALPSQEYFLTKGFYEFEYFTYSTIKFDNLNTNVFLGSDLNSNNHINAILDQVKIYNEMITDTRIGESVPNNKLSITKDFNLVKGAIKDNSTLLLLDFNKFPFTNKSDFYTYYSTKKNFQSSVSVNDSFDKSIVFKDIPIILENDGILDTKKEGSIEFWINPIYDTSNDPTERFYFDAFGAVIEEVTSINNVSVKISSPASQILSVKINNIDYLAGGRLEIDTQNSIVEQLYSITNTSVMVSKNILQVISVKIVDDFTETDYFENGIIDSDNKTIILGKMLPSNNCLLKITYQPTSLINKLNSQVIRLNKKLPSQNSKVSVTYIPKGMQGDRISIYKDVFGYINFGIRASEKDFIVRAPTRWAKNTWHRVKASYKINTSNNQDDLKLFLDGYEYRDALFGEDLIFGDFPVVMGAVFPGDGYSFNKSIKFNDSINYLFLGSEYTSQKGAYALIDNLRISNILRPIYAPYGESIDVNYNANLNTAFPVTEDLYTTYLLDFNNLTKLNKDFVLLRNRSAGAFDFSINIFDSFDIINNSSKVKAILEKLIKMLKPANTQAFIKYIENINE